MKKELKISFTIVFTIIFVSSLITLNVRADVSSNTIWQRTYGGTDWDVAYSVVQSSDGGYAVAGGTYYLGEDVEDFWLVKTDQYGGLVWNQTYGGDETDAAYSLIETSDGGFALAGITYSFGEGDQDVWLVKTDQYGGLVWNQTYGGDGIDVAYSLVQTSDGGFALAGYTESYGAGGYDFWLLKTDEMGIPEFPSWIILPLFLVVTLIAIYIRRRLHLLDS